MNIVSDAAERDRRTGGVTVKLVKFPQLPSKSRTDRDHLGNRRDFVPTKPCVAGNPQIGVVRIGKIDTVDRGGRERRQRLKQRAGRDRESRVARVTGKEGVR